MGLRGHWLTAAQWHSLLWHPLITKTNTHWLCTGSPVHPLLSKPVAKPPPHSLPTAFLTGMLAGSPSLPFPLSQTESTALGMPGRPVKSDLTCTSLLACQEHQMDVCAPHSSSPLLPSSLIPHPG